MLLAFSGVVDMRAFFALFLGAVFLVTACGLRKTESREAVQKAIEAYLSQRPNLALSNMDLELGDVKFEGDRATADVKLRSKQSADLTVTVQYRLKRQGDQWHVEAATPGAGPGGSPHGSVAPSSPRGGSGLESSH
jgi:hypothetical protein